MRVDELSPFIHDFWFGKIAPDGLCDAEKSARWWSKDADFDRLIAEKFGSFLPSALSGELDNMLKTPYGTLAFTVLTDQFPRNIHRGKPESFAFDTVALAACRKGIKSAFDRRLRPVERTFFYMPLMHSEEIAIQRLSVETFKSLADEFSDGSGLGRALARSADFAVKHFEIIERFGRYPHRNEILGRKSSPEEIEFLKQPGSSF